VCDRTSPFVAVRAIGLRAVNHLLSSKTTSCVAFPAPAEVRFVLILRTRHAVRNDYEEATASTSGHSGDFPVHLEAGYYCLQTPNAAPACSLRLARHCWPAMGSSVPRTSDVARRGRRASALRVAEDLPAASADRDTTAHSPGGVKGEAAPIRDRDGRTSKQSGLPATPPPTEPAQMLLSASTQASAASGPPRQGKGVHQQAIPAPTAATAVDGVVDADGAASRHDVSDERRCSCTRGRACSMASDPCVM
jgi:hypothetical protein